MVLLAAVEMSLGLVRKNIPAGSDSSTIVTRKYVADLVKKGWGFPAEILNAAARASKQLKKECYEDIAAIDQKTRIATTKCLSLRSGRHRRGECQRT